MLYVGNGTLLHKTKFISFPPVRGKGQWLTIPPEQKDKLESLLVQKGFLGGVFLVAFFLVGFFWLWGFRGLRFFFGVLFACLFLFGWSVGLGFFRMCVLIFSLFVFLLRQKKDMLLMEMKWKWTWILIMRKSRGRNSHNSKLILWYPKCLENVLSTLQNFKLY